MTKPCGFIPTLWTLLRALPFRLLVLMLLTAAFASCSGDTSPEPSGDDEPSATDLLSQWAVHVYAGEPAGEGWKRTDVPPSGFDGVDPPCPDEYG